MISRHLLAPRARASTLALLACSWLLPALILTAPAAAQEATGAMSGFSMDSDEPVRIESDELEVNDREQIAIFSGSVVVEQGDTVMRTPRLQVHYTGSAGTDASGEGGGAAQSISRLEAHGGVVVETREQKASGEWAVFEMATQEITLGGDVVLTQGDNVLRGTSLVVNLETGSSRLLSDGQSGGGRVQGLFIPGGMGQKQD